MSSGTCRLTNHKGNFVKSHLIPKAFTRPEEPGLPLLQSAPGKRAIKRWDSWYDAQLVTRRGENILEAYDTWGIAYLRTQKLVWSGWGEAESLGDLSQPIGDGSWGLREVPVESPHMLRLFFLSLLWRAAASSLMEFAEVQLPHDHLESLRSMVVAGDPGPVAFYPVTLTQLSTRGIVHNMAPIAQTKWQPEVEGVPSRDIPIFRFYFDGLIAHITRQGDDDGWAAELGNLVVGQGRTLAVSTVTYEASFQKENLGHLMRETIW